jgi:hypothetical protein
MRSASRCQPLVAVAQSSDPCPCRTRSQKDGLVATDGGGVASPTRPVLTSRRHGRSSKALTAEMRVGRVANATEPAVADAAVRDYFRHCRIGRSPTFGAPRAHHTDAPSGIVTPGAAIRARGGPTPDPSSRVRSGARLADAGAPSCLPGVCAEPARSAPSLSNSPAGFACRARQVDTHLDVNVAASVGRDRRTVPRGSFEASGAGNHEPLGWLPCFGPDARVGVEGTGSYGPGCPRLLGTAGVEVVEVDRPNRQVRRRHGKSDPVDAVEARRPVIIGRSRMPLPGLRTRGSAPACGAAPPGRRRQHRGASGRAE